MPSEDSEKLVAEAVEDGQWSDEAYLRARENQYSAGGEIDGDLGG